MEKHFEDIVKHKGVQELFKKGKQKDLRLRCGKNDTNFLTVSCDLDTVEYGYVGKDFDVNKMNKMLHNYQLKH